jgi:hypothetical protein
MIKKRLNPAIKSRFIEEQVRCYFRLYAREAYDGRVHINDVIKTVRRELNTKLNARMEEENMGEVYDYIREYGPVGEDDKRWLATWSKAPASSGLRIA